MKNLLLLLCVASFSLLSCGGEDCEPGTFDSNIVGTWETPALGASEAGTVTFNADGTGVGSDDGIFYSELNGEGSGAFDWSYNMADETMTVDWRFTNGSLGLDYNVVSFDCDDTTFEFILNFTIKRQ